MNTINYKKMSTLIEVYAKYHTSTMSEGAPYKCSLK